MVAAQEVLMVTDPHDVLPDGSRLRITAGRERPFTAGETEPLVNQPGRAVVRP
jgi:hypothetical protein